MSNSENDPKSEPAESRSDKKRAILKTTAFLFCVFFLISSFTGVLLLSFEKKNVDDYFDRHNITNIPVMVPMRDGVSLSCMVHMNSNIVGRSDKASPTIIWVPGINNDKYNGFGLKFQYLMAGYTVVSVDQRGHGESGGYFTFYEKECHDITDIINYLDNNFLQLNTTHIGLLGMSLGGGTIIGAQALDDRVFCTVAYHPAANLTDLFSEIGVDPLVYFGYTPGMIKPVTNEIFPDWERVRVDSAGSHDTINFVNETNTNNLLILHGSRDDLVRPENSYEILSRADPTNTSDDLQIVIRPGLTHGGNEGNSGSLRYAMAWFNHFYKNSSVDITDLDTETYYITLVENDFPSESRYLQFFKFAFVALIAFLFVLLFVRIAPVKYDFSKKSLKTSWKGSDDPEIQEEYKQTFIVRSIALTAIYIISSLYCRMTNPSVLYGFVLFPAILSIPVMLFLPITKYRTNKRSNIKNETDNEPDGAKTEPKDPSKENGISDPKSEPESSVVTEDSRAKHVLKLVKRNFGIYFGKESVVRFIFSMLIFVVPMYLYTMAFDLGRRVHFSGAVNPGFIGLINLAQYAVIIAMTWLYLRELPGKYSLWSILTHFVGVLLGTLILPLDPLFGIPQIALFPLLAIALAIAHFIIFGLVVGVKKLITQNSISAVFLITSILTIFLWYRVLRVI